MIAYYGLDGALPLGAASPLGAEPLVPVPALPGVAPVAVPDLLLCCACRMHCSLRSPERLSHWAAVIGALVADDSDLPGELCANAVPLNAIANAAAVRYARDVMSVSSVEGRLPICE
jgi:hypothetical protein